MRGLIAACLFVPLSLSAAELAVIIEPFHPTPDRGTVMLVNTAVANTSDNEVREVTALITLNAPKGIVLAGYSDAVWSCGDAGTLQSVRCNAASLPAKSTTPLILFVAPAVEGRFTITAQAGFFRADRQEVSAYATRQSALYRHVAVTTTNDDGQGSLRHAILRANEEGADWLPVGIFFDLPGEQTITPLTPLPLITAKDVAIDGESRITLDGSRLSSGGGFEIVGLGFLVIRGMRVIGFPADGVRFARDFHSIIENNEISGNGQRGIRVVAPGSGYVIRNNRIFSNARSGIFLESGYQWIVEENDIRDNGASGVFLGDGLYEGLVRRNTITGNRDSGVAVAWRASKALIAENSISRNENIGIDRGIDGFSGYDFDDYDVYRAKIPPPRVTSAVYDEATATTVITGSYFDARDHWGEWEAALFSNDLAEPQGKTYLGSVTASQGVFTLRVAGDLRGMFITATGERNLHLGWSGDHAWTSEFGDPIGVR